MRPRLLAAVALATLAGCGGATVDRPQTDATLLLDRAAAPVHAGILLADARTYDDAEGVHLRIRTASRSTEPARRLQTGRARFAVMGLRRLAGARRRGADLVAVMAIVQPPLSGSGMDRDAGDPLVLVTTRATVQDEPALVRATVTSLRRGYEEAIADPESAITVLLERRPSLDRSAAQRALDRLLPAFTRGVERFGRLEPRRFERWAARSDHGRPRLAAEGAFATRFSNAAE